MPLIDNNDASGLKRLNAANFSSGVLKQQFGGTGQVGQAFAEFGAVGFSQYNGHYTLVTPGISLTAAGFYPLFITPSTINNFIPTSYQVIVTNTAGTGLVASSSAVYSLSAGCYVGSTLDTATTLAYPVVGASYSKSLVGSSGVSANSTVYLDVTTAAPQNNYCTATVIVQGICI